MQLWELDGLLLSSALAAARWLASDSLVGLLGHLLPAGDLSRALLCLSAHLLCRMCSCRHRVAATGKEQLRALNFFKLSILPYTVRVPRSSNLACTITHACMC